MVRTANAHVKKLSNFCTSAPLLIDPRFACYVYRRQAFGPTTNEERAIEIVCVMQN